MNLEVFWLDPFSEDNQNLITLSTVPAEKESADDSLALSPVSSLGSFDFDSRIFSESGGASVKKEEISSSKSSPSEQADKYLILKTDQPILLRVRRPRGIRYVKYHFQKKLAQGAYGQVVWYRQNSTETAPQDLCFKVGFKLGDLDADVQVLDHLQIEKGCVKFSGLVPTRTAFLKIDSDGELVQPLLIMPKMDGSLKQLLGQLEFPSLIDKYWLVSAILYSINMVFYQLVKENIYYTDIKISNILYRLESEQQLFLGLGDLGSAFQGGQQEAIATFPNPDRSRCHHFTPIAFDLTYGLMILFLEMMTTSSKKGSTTKETGNVLDREVFQGLFHENIKEVEHSMRPVILQNIFSNLEELTTSDGLSEEEGTLIDNFHKTIRKVCFLKADRSKKANTQTILKSLLPIWQDYYKKFSQFSQLARTIRISLV